MTRFKDCMTGAPYYGTEIKRLQPQHGKKCLKKYYKDILLVIVYHFPKYDSIPHLEGLYKDAFPNIAICGPKKDRSYSVDIIVKNHGGLLAYNCLGRAVQIYPGYEGYFYINDDMIVNWWNFREFDRSKIWQGALIENGHPLREGSGDNITYKTKWVWYNSSFGLEQCNKTLKEISTLKPHNWQPKKLYENLKYNGNGKTYCSKGWSDFFYIPRVHAEAFSTICDMFYKNNVFLEIAVTTMLRLLDSQENTIKITGHYLPDIGPSDSKAFWTYYRTDIKFMHPFKFHVKPFEKMNVALLRNWVIKYSKQFLEC